MTGLSALCFAKTRAALTVVRPLGILAAMLALLALAGYVIGIDILYRPLAGGPATNPLTAVTALLLALAVIAARPWRRRRVTLALGAAAAVAAATPILDALAGTGLAVALTPFADVVAAEHAAGANNAMGVNTAAMLGLIAVAVMLRALGTTRASQFAAFIALGFPIVTLTGYAYGLPRFHGQMSLSTLTLATPLAIAAAAMTAHRSTVRAVLSPYIGGRIARAQIVLGYLVPLGLGFLMLSTASRHVDHSLFGLFVVAVSWFIIALVSVAAVVQERIDHARRIAERALGRAASTDPLTGLANRRRFFDIGGREVARCARAGTPVSVLMIDVDHFKEVNDRLGHAAGDAVLVALAGTLHAASRATDLTGRLGGEEFAVLLPDTPPLGALTVAEQIRARIEATELDVLAPLGRRLTVSVGCATFEGATDLDQLLAEADLALYRAKHTGRNRVETAILSADGTSPDMHREAG